jgi:DNA-binding MarR family transcriptional regulator
MMKLAAMFSPPAKVIADFHSIREEAEFAIGRKEILSILQRRPCSINDIADGLGMHQNEVVKYIDELSGEELIEKTFTAGRVYYRPSGQSAV